ncbi:hypothetical protein [Paraburkholderia hospita]|uniref:hypothetical protein n=1 Tax=Paraburkholderia hospita TaxID=169430 RepID=UPI0008A759D8|nr:hypothetical protein [Paraburkholderia hospita]SEH42537.1 hypothetical protein SAMN05192544_1001430 [Paraburkholderia hospita]
MPQTSFHTIDRTAAINAIETVTSALERAVVGLQNLRNILVEAEAAPEFDPKDPANKFSDRKLTPRGIEICYRLFDAGHTRYAVKELMEISFSAADNRWHSWQQAGGAQREKQPL